MFIDLNDLVHVGEKWFYLLSDVQVVRVFRNHHGTLPIPGKILPQEPHAKGNIPCCGLKESFWIQYRWEDRDLALRIRAPCQRSNKSYRPLLARQYIGRYERQRRREYQEKIMGKDGVFDKIRKKMRLSWSGSGYQHIEKWSAKTWKIAWNKTEWWKINRN